MVAPDREGAADIDVVAVDCTPQKSTYITSPASTGRRDGGEWVRHQTSGPAETIVRMAGSSPPRAAITEFEVGGDLELGAARPHVLGQRLDGGVDDLGGAPHAGQLRLAT